MHNGVKALAALSGLDEREVAWMFKRTKELIAAGRSPDECRRIIRAEAVSKPWKVLGDE